MVGVVLVVVVVVRTPLLNGRIDDAAFGAQLTLLSLPPTRHPTPPYPTPPPLLHPPIYDAAFGARLAGGGGGVRGERGGGDGGGAQPPAFEWWWGEGWEG